MKLQNGTQTLRHTQHLVTRKTLEHQHLGIWTIKALEHSANRRLGNLAEAYLEPSRTSTIELFCSNQLLLQKASILDVWVGCKYASAIDT